MTDTQLLLTNEERDYLSNLLAGVLKEKRVEEHRTRAPSYRQVVLEQETIIAGLLHKLEAADSD